jgi:hypothetical protein
MAEYAGSAAVVTWVYSGGTLNMSADTRTVSVNTSMDTIDATAGQDVNKVYLPSFASVEITWEGVAQDSTQGTVYAQALKNGNLGTVNVSPYGTAGSALKYSMAAFCLGLSTSMPYADVVTLSTSWQTASGGSLNITTN